MSQIKTSLVHRHGTTDFWATNDFIPLKGEFVIYDADSECTYERFKIGDGETSVTKLPFASTNPDEVMSEATEETVKLASDLYAYTSIGAIYASNTSPTKVASAGESLKTVFNAVFGTQKDQEPTVSNNSIKLNVSSTAGSYGGGEYGTPVSSTSFTVTFTLAANYGTASYGYRCGDIKTTGYQTFYYPIEKQNEADIKITLPSGTASASMVTTGSCVKAEGKVLYCNFANNKVSIKIDLPASTVTTSSQTRYGQISAVVKFGAAQDANGNTITKFLTYLGNDADSKDSYLTITDKTNNSSAVTISAGSYYSYYIASTSNNLATVAKGESIRYTGSSISIKLDAEKYIWFLLPSGTGSKTIQYEALGQWYEFSGGTSGPTDISITLDNGVTATYKGYHTNKKAAVGTTSFRIV